MIGDNQSAHHSSVPPWKVGPHQMFTSKSSSLLPPFQLVFILMGSLQVSSWDGVMLSLSPVLDSYKGSILVVAPLASSTLYNYISRNYSLGLWVVTCRSCGIDTSLCIPLQNIHSLKTRFPLGSSHNRSESPEPNHSSPEVHDGDGVAGRCASREPGWQHSISWTRTGMYRCISISVGFWLSKLFRKPFSLRWCPSD